MADTNSSKGSMEASKLPLRELGGFEILEKLGAGAMGAVFKARQISLNRIVALKVLPPQLAKNEEFVQRFLREARASAALDHPNIVKGIDAGKARGVHYFAMELVKGETVGARLKREGRLPAEDVIEIGRQMALALTHAHEKGLLHRDIKPENLMLTNVETGGARFVVKLMDLGLARDIEDDAGMTQSGHAVGTPYYISPEQARGDRNLTGACDVYALGCTLLHLVSGKTPYSGETGAVIMSKHLTAPPPDPQVLCPEISRGLSAVLKKCMAKEPRLRYATGTALAEDLERLAQGQRPLHASEKSETKGPQRAVRKGSAPAGGASAHLTRGRRTKVGAQDQLQTPGPSQRGWTRGFPVLPTALGAGVLVLVLAILAFRGAKNPVVENHAMRGKETARPPAKDPETEGVTETESTQAVRDLKNEIKAREEALKQAEAERERLYQAALAIAKDQSGGLEAQQRAWRALLAASADATPYAAKAALALENLKKSFERQVEEDVQKLIFDAHSLALEKNYDEALAMLSAWTHPRQNAKTLELIRGAQQELAQEGSSAGARLLDEAERVRAQGDLATALEACQRAAQFKYTPISEAALKKCAEIEGLVQRAQVAAEAAAAESFSTFAKDIFEQVRQRKWDEAKQALSRAQADKKLAPKRALLAVLDDGLASLETLKTLIAEGLDDGGARGIDVPHLNRRYKALANDRLQFEIPQENGKPIPSSERLQDARWETLIALSGLGGPKPSPFVTMLAPQKRVSLAGLLALAGRPDLARSVFAELSTSDDEALKQRISNWTEIILIVEHGAAESMASSQFEQLQNHIKNKQWKQADLVINSLLDETYSKTPFFNQHRPEIEAMQEMVIEQLALIDASRIPLSKLVHAKVRPMAGNLVELTYDFSTPEQLEDFSALHGTWSIGEGRLKVAELPNDGLLWLKVPFEGTQLTVRYEGDAPMDLNCLIGPQMVKSTTAGYSFRFGRTKNTLCELLDPADQSLHRTKDKLVVGQPNQVLIKREGQNIVGCLNGSKTPLTFEARGSELIATRFVAFQTWENAWFDNLVILGKVDPKWEMEKRKAVFMKQTEKSETPKRD